MLKKEDNTRCPICGCSDTSFLHTELIDVKGLRTITLCNNCRHGWDPVLRVDLAAYYESLYRKPRPPAFNLGYWRISHTLRKMRGTQTTRVLDVGANNGRFLWHLPKNWALNGIEYAVEAANIARTFVGANIYTGKVEDIDLSKNCTYDIITLLAVIEHLENPVAILAKLVKCLAPDGIMCIMTGDRTSKLARARNTGWLMYRHAGHLHFFSKTSLDFLLKSMDMSIVKHYWTTGNVVNFRFGILNKIFNMLYDLSPLTNKAIFDHRYIFAKKISRLGATP